MSMKVEMWVVGDWISRGKVKGEVIGSRLIGSDGEVRLEGEWGRDDNGRVEIKSRSKNARLSNFSRIGKDGFMFDNCYCRGLEGFVQGVKFEDENLQKECCSKVGFRAWSFGQKEDWKSEQKLYWKGMEMDREGEEYGVLIEEFFDSVYKDEEVNRNKLLLSGDLVLVHSSGNKSKRVTVLNEEEFIGNLVRVRNELFRELDVEVVWLAGEGERDVKEVEKKEKKEKVVRKNVKEVDGEERDLRGGLVLIRRNGVWEKK